MSILDHGPLGQKSEYPEHYDPSVLHPITRELGRREIGLQADWPYRGEDVWNAYEVSWLLPSGKPEVAMLELRVPALSRHIVESKSLKLYLGSFNQSVFADRADVEARIAADVGAVVGATVQARLLNLNASVLDQVAALPGICIDDEDVTATRFTVDPGLLRIGSDTVVDEELYSHLLRSCCPVTGQPDWASVWIRYRGPQLDRAALLQYLISFRNNQEFHEQCVERIFLDLQRLLKPQQLTVYARYTRRGGIDINPWRSTESGEAPNWRLVRQ